MNKREKAVWNIVILISVILIGVFSYLILSNFTIRNKNIENFRFSLKNAGKYSLPIDNSNILIGLIEKYDLNINDVIRRTRAADGIEVSETEIKNFMENKAVSKKGSKPYSSVHGFSLENEKIKSGEYLLTEIPGRVFNTSKCSNPNNLFLKNISFMNDSKMIDFKDLDFIEKEVDITKTYIEETINTDGFGKDDYIINLKENHGEDWMNHYSEADWGPLNTNIIENQKENHTNYFYTKTNNNNNLEVYINTQDEIDEYSFEISCYECFISDLEERLNELEISLVKQKEPSFILPPTSTDPTDLSNVIILEGQDGYNQNKKFRTIQPTAFITNRTTGKKQVSILFKGIRNNFEEGDMIDGGEIIKINKDNLLFEKNGKIDTLMMTN